MSKETKSSLSLEHTVDSDRIGHSLPGDVLDFHVVLAHNSNDELPNDNIMVSDSDDSLDTEAIVEGEQFYCHVCGKSFFSSMTRAAHESSHHANRLHAGLATSVDCPPVGADVDTEATESADEVCYWLKKEQKTSKDGPSGDADVATDATETANELCYGLKEEQKTSRDGTPVDIADTNNTHCGLEKHQVSKDGPLPDADTTNSATNSGLYCRTCNVVFVSTFLYTLHMKHHEFQDSVQVLRDTDVERTSSKEDPAMTSCDATSMTVSTSDEINNNSRTDMTVDVTSVNSSGLTSRPETFDSQNSLCDHEKGHLPNEVCNDIQTRVQTGGKAVLGELKLGRPVLLQHAKGTKMADSDMELLKDKITKMAGKDAELLQDEITKLADKSSDILEDQRNKMVDKDAVILQRDKRTKMAGKDVVILQRDKQNKMVEKGSGVLHQDKITKMADKDEKVLQDRRTKKVDEKVKTPDYKYANVGSSVPGFDPRGYCLVSESQFLEGMHKEESSLPQKYDKSTNKCRLCQRSFTTHAGLDIHMRSHSDKKPFVCPICGERFVLGVHLYVHKRKHPEMCSKSIGHSKRGNGYKKSKNNDDNNSRIKTKKCFNFYHKTFRCECGRSFANSSNLMRHRRLHKDPESRMFNSESNNGGDSIRKVVCPLCKKTFTNVSNLLAHKKNTHSGKQRINEQQIKRKTSTDSSNNTGRYSSWKPPTRFKHTCPYCGTAIRRGWNVKRHMSICTNLPAQAIENVITKRTSFSKTTTTTTTTTKAVSVDPKESTTGNHGFTCDLCDREMSTVGSHKRHISRHLNPKCRLFISTVNLTLLKKQISILDNDGITCAFCSKVCRCKFSLVQHLKVHTGIKPYACAECDCSYTLKENLRRHTKVKHGWKSRRRYTHVGRHTDTKMLPSQVRKTDSEHGKGKHREDSTPSSKINLIAKKHVCRLCMKSFTCFKLLVEHKNMHCALKPFKCSHCGKKFISMRGKTGHELHFHGPLSNECQELKSSNTKHKDIGNPVVTYDRKASTKSKPVSVLTDPGSPVSDRPTDDDDDENLDEDIHVCVVCDKTFRYERLLSQHMLIHTGELPWACQLCERRFGTFVHLARHVTCTHSDIYRTYKQDQHEHLVKFMEDRGRGGN